MILNKEISKTSPTVSTSPFVTRILSPTCIKPEVTITNYPNTDINRSFNAIAIPADANPKIVTRYETLSI